MIARARRMRMLGDRRTRAMLAVPLAIILFVSVNMAGRIGLRGVHLDLTQNAQFTLSQGTIEILQSLEEPVRVRLYVSNAIRSGNAFLADYADRVHALLLRYREVSDGMLQVDYLDPEPFSPQEDRALGFGLQPVSIGVEGANGYLGLAGTNSTADTDIIPVLSPERERFLEYDLTRLVYNLANPQKPVVALLSSLPIGGDPALGYEPWQVYRELSQFYDIRLIGGEVDRFEDDVDALWIVHPKELGQRTLFAIDQFVLDGGRALAFLDPHSEAAAARRQQPTPAADASDLPALLLAWGLRLTTDRVVADPFYARQVQFARAGQPQVADYLVWLSLEGEALDAQSRITSELGQINLASAGALESAADASDALEPLILSSAGAALVPVSDVAPFPDPMALLRGFASGEERRVLATKVAGPFASAFSEVLPEGVDEPEDRLRSSVGEPAVVVVADSDILDDRNWLLAQNLLGQSVSLPIADNADFVANALDQLTGSAALASLRGREVVFRPFSRVVALRREAEAAYRTKEQELLEEMRELQGKLDRLDVPSGEQGSLIGTAQREEIEGFRRDLLSTRAELREVQYALGRDIELLRSRVQLVNIALMPVLVGLAGVGVALWKRRSARRRFKGVAA